MDYVFVLEDEESYRRSISKALKAIDPKIKTKFFKDMEEFYQWLKAAMTKTGRTLESEVDDMTPERIRLMVVKAEIVAPANLGLLAKARELFMNRGLCTSEFPTGFVMTAFDEADFKFEAYKQTLLFNLLFKPFDDIILTQHLSSALAGYKKPEESTLSNQKTSSAFAEMLKPIELTAVSDIGFTSKSKKNYPLGVISKYYSGIFVSGTSRSIYATLARSTEIGPEQFELDYRFFAGEQNQIANIRKAVRLKDKGKPMERGPGGGEPLANPNFVVIEPREAEFNLLAATIKRRFGGAQIFRYMSRADFEKDLNFPLNSTKGLTADTISIEIDKGLILKKPVPSDLTLFGKPLTDLDLSPYLDKPTQNQVGLWLLGSQKELMLFLRSGNFYAALKLQRSGNLLSLVIPSQKEKEDFLRTKRQMPDSVHYLIACLDIEPSSIDSWEAFKASLKTMLKLSPECYLVTSKTYSDENKIKLSHYFNDVFYNPLDRAYFLLKLIYSKYAMKVLEDRLYITEKAFTEKVYAAARVQVEEISEAGISFRYPGKVDLGSFREFVFERPNDANVPILTGVCYSCEPIEGSETNESTVYFVFFGVRDHELKFIRLWIRENYVHSKEKGS